MEESPSFLDAGYWNERYVAGDIPWNTGTCTPALIHYIQDFPKDAAILIPGAGTSMEGIEMARMGFTNLTFVDLSQEALFHLQKQIEAEGLGKDFRYLCEDFFAMKGQYDVIMEQTFFCAIDPTQRVAFVHKIYQLLKDGGTWFGVLFNHYFEKAGPPFGGSEKEYNSLFSRKLNIKEMSICKESILPRAGNELFFICKKLVND